MSDFIRPEARQWLARWNEALIGGAVMCLGGYWAFFTGGGLLHWFGFLVMGLGVLMIVVGIQRGRFRQDSDGPGVVGLVEGRISYFGPESGGIVDLQGLSSLVLDPVTDPPCWVLRQPGFDPLRIPLTAKGADVLFDAFSSLPGIRTEHMLRQMQAGADHQVVIWRAADLQASTPTLH